jgi:enoyl-CoA hydratase/carnithine racemase
MSEIEIERDAGVATIFLNRPERKNAVNGELLEQWLAALREVRSRAEDRVLVLAARGPVFSAGAELGWITNVEEPVLDVMRRSNQIVLELQATEKPTVAAVRGLAAGGAMNVALGCDFVVASETAKFVQPYVKVGLSVDSGASWLLPRLVGLRRATELAMLGDGVTAADALSMGLINRVAADGELEAATLELARRLAAGPSQAQALIKRALQVGAGSGLAEALEAEARALAIGFAGPELSEAVAAMEDRRPPRFA